jgi:SPX domain protein involved in polyphosphate accumulation
MNINLKKNLHFQYQYKSTTYINLINILGISEDDDSDDDETEEEFLKRVNVQLEMLKVSMEGVIENFECITAYDTKMISFMKSKLKDMTMESTREYKQASIRGYFNLSSSPRSSAASSSASPSAPSS